VTSGVHTEGGTDTLGGHWGPLELGLLFELLLFFFREPAFLGGTTTGWERESAGWDKPDSLFTKGITFGMGFGGGALGITVSIGEMVTCFFRISGIEGTRRTVLTEEDATCRESVASG
jgi:hypothetical protein